MSQFAAIGKTATRTAGCRRREGRTVGALGAADAGAGRPSRPFEKRGAAPYLRYGRPSMSLPAHFFEKGLLTVGDGLPYIAVIAGRGAAERPSPVHGGHPAALFDK
jgi:hypothetical protein